mmetsp:Transcript_38389/g.83515  ORF Transcript_38389/g.83515 Transcript_38389/m.83515 type:complete len:89 (-) Transcript_38389:543-809(-)
MGAETQAPSVRTLAQLSERRSGRARRPPPLHVEVLSEPAVESPEGEEKAGGEGGAGALRRACARACATRPARYIAPVGGGLPPAESGR